MMMYLVVFMMGMVAGAGLITLGYVLGKNVSDRAEIDEILNMIENK